MNKPARKHTAPLSGPRVSLGASHLLFESHVETLDWHDHSFVCVLMGVGGPIDIRWKHGQAQADIILVPPSWSHHLMFHGQRMASIYYAPHQQLFSRLAYFDTPLISEWSASWEEAYTTWRLTDDATDLQSLIASHFAKAEQPVVDARVKQLVRGFWEGKGLHDAIEELSASVGVSASRLAHLVKQHTGSSLRGLKRGYRFWHAARGMLTGTNFTEVAHLAGFADAAHFSRTFRRTYGLAPSRILLEATEWRDVQGLG